MLPLTTGRRRRRRRGGSSVPRSGVWQVGATEKRSQTGGAPAAGRYRAAAPAAACSTDYGAKGVLLSALLDIGRERAENGAEGDRLSTRVSPLRVPPCSACPWVCVTWRRKEYLGLRNGLTI